VSPGRYYMGHRFANRAGLAHDEVTLRFSEKSALLGFGRRGFILPPSAESNVASGPTAIVRRAISGFLA
jgi:hypothetical protein